VVLLRSGNSYIVILNLLFRFESSTFETSRPGIPGYRFFDIQHIEVINDLYPMPVPRTAHRTARLVYMKQGLRLSEDFTAWDAPFTLSRPLDMVSMLGNDLCCEGVTGVVARRNLHEVERPPRCLDAQSVAWPRIGGHVE
jgi:hypothetical protein